MKSIFVKTISLAVFLILVSPAYEALAQYNTGIGLRLGSGNGISFKQFVSEDAAVEALVYSRWRGLIVAGLYEVHFDISQVRGLQWFAGGGAHFGTWNSAIHNLPRVPEQRSMQTFGLDGIIGLDYKFYNSPVNLSLDWKPAFNFNDAAGFWWDEVAVSVRFAF